MDDSKLKRVMSAVEEFAANKMEVEQHTPNQFTVKGYTVNTRYSKCECKDHEYNEQHCKHLVAAGLYGLWDANTEPDTPKSAISSDGGGPKIPTDYDSIPNTLTSFETWLVWEYRGTGDRRAPTPLNPETGNTVSGIEDSVSYERAVNIDKAHTPETDGVMFLLTKYDPFTVEKHTDVRDPVSAMVHDALKSNVKNPLSYLDVAPNGSDVIELKIGEEHATEISPNPIPLTGTDVTTEDVRDVIA